LRMWFKGMLENTKMPIRHSFKCSCSTQIRTYTGNPRINVTVKRKTPRPRRAIRSRAADEEGMVTN
jgi:hypothetical protein